MQVSPHVVAAYHQHLFCARLDLAVDCDEGGKNLVVSEVGVGDMCQHPQKCRMVAPCHKQHDMFRVQAVSVLLWST